MQTMQHNQTLYTLQMLQDADNFAFNGGFGNLAGYYSNQMRQQTDNNNNKEEFIPNNNNNTNIISLAKEEPKDDLFFDSFLN
ncbi:hypothetical protein CASFOL_032035 [Castilleja foliolosa]